MELPNVIFPLFPFQTPATSFSFSFPTVQFHPGQPTSLVALRMLMCVVSVASGWKTDGTRRGLSVRKQKVAPGCGWLQRGVGLRPGAVGGFWVMKILVLPTASAPLRVSRW